MPACPSVCRDDSWNLTAPFVPHNGHRNISFSFLFDYADAFLLFLAAFTNVCLLHCMRYLLAQHLPPRAISWNREQ